MKVKGDEGRLSHDIAAKIADLRFGEGMQERIEYLADRSNKGLLTVAEREEYSGYLQAADLIAVLKAKAR